MTSNLVLAAGLANSGKVLGALSLLLRSSYVNTEEQLIAADHLLGRLLVEDFENWARFNILLLRRFEGLLAAPQIDPGQLLDRWVASVREKGLGFASALFIRRLKEGLDFCSDAAVRSFGDVALTLLESGNETLPTPLERFALANKDAFLLMKYFFETRRFQAARHLAELRLRNSNGSGMWDYHWYSRILHALGQHNAAYDAQYQFIGLALQQKDSKHIQNGVAKAIELIPFCQEMKTRVAQLRKLLAGRSEFENEFCRLERLINDIEMFRSQAPVDEKICIGRHFYRAADLQVLEDNLQRELRLNPSPVVLYELAKISALNGDASSAREMLITATCLDAQYFGRTTGYA